MTIARYEATGSTFKVCQRAKAVVLQFEEPFRTIEWALPRGDGQRLKRWEHRLEKYQCQGRNKGSTMVDTPRSC
jgi:hypothetical protein